MAFKFSPKFQEAYARVLAVAEASGEEAGRVAFRDEMVAIGHLERIRNMYRIKDKLTFKPMQFVPNAAQEYYLTSRQGRDIILKPRQVGYTTMSAVRGLDKALWEQNASCMILAHHQKTVATIFNDLVKFTYDWFKRDWAHLYKPVEKNDNSTELIFKNDGLGRVLDSSMRVLFDGRGKTPNFLHVSEASRVENDRLLGTCNGVPITGEIIFESTANGRGGRFYELWQLHRTNGKTAPYRGHFIPWFAIYPEKPESWQIDSDTTWTEYEQKLMADFSEIQPHHLLWRRWCIDANCNGDPDQFENEYPSNDIDCFLTGEFSVFPATLLKAQDRNTRALLKSGFLVNDNKKLELHEDAKGVIDVWKLPDPSKTYVIGADPSGGVGKDKAAAYVKDQKSKELVARIWADLEPADFARELYKLACFYNRAWLCVESNNHGHTVLHELKERGYPNLYKRRVLDEMTAKPTHKVGFLTTNDQKLRITEQLKSACKEGDLVVTDKALIDEMSTFCQYSSKTGRGMRREAASGSHDDLVMAAALTQEMDSARGIVDSSSENREATDMREAEVDSMTGFAY